MAAPATDSMRDRVTFCLALACRGSLATCPARSIVGDHLLPAAQVPGTADADAQD